MPGKELSGPDWVGRFPDLKTTAALADDFRPGCEAFIAAMKAAGASVIVSSTVRPDERAYLMYTAWRIVKGEMTPDQADSEPGVDIDWVHRRPDGSMDLAASRAAAAKMVAAYDIAFAPARKSRHTEGRAIDMTIEWAGALTIKNKDGSTVTISSTPRNGAGNLDLRRVGKTYTVIKLATDPPHWSKDGH